MSRSRLRVFRAASAALAGLTLGYLRNVLLVLLATARSVR
jgi:hypothetical protein